MSKEIGQLVKSLDSFSDGQLSVLEVDWDESQWITLEVKPNAGPYKGGTYQFKIEPLNVKTLKPLLHPNISSHDTVCITFDEAADSHGLEISVIGLLYVLQEPNYDDAYGYWTYGKNGKEAYRNIRVSLTGRKIGQFEGPKYIEDDDEILEFLEEMKKEEEEKRRKEEEERANEASRGDEEEDGEEEESEGDAASIASSQENTADLNTQAPLIEDPQSPISNSHSYSEIAHAEDSASNESTPHIESIHCEPEPSTSTGVRSDLDSAASTHADVLPTFASLTTKETQLNSPEL